MRARTAASRSGMSSYTSVATISLFELRDHALGLRGILAFGRDLDVGLERSDGLRELAFIQQRHAELIVGVGVVRVALDRLFELDLRLGDLALVPQDDALVERRV